MRKIILIYAICFFFFSCVKEHKRTEKICDQKLYMEIYERNQLGVCYLTDSTNFKIYVDQLNFENEHYSYKCISDSVFISKISEGLGGDSTNYKVIAEYNYNIKELKKEKRHEE
jgi:hypothetical protein